MKKIKIFLTVALLLFGLGLRAEAVTADFFVTGGTDATATTSTALTPSDITKLGTSDDSRIQTNGNWPIVGAYDENKYLELLFTPNIPSDATITSVSLTHEYRRNAVIHGAKLEVWNGSSFLNHSLVVPGNSSDVSDTIDLSSEITTPAQVNNLKARFLAFRNTSVASVTTSHDFAKLTVDYTPAPLPPPPPPPPLMHNIMASAGSGGVITPSGLVVVNDGADQPFAITADPGFNILDVLVDSASVGVVSDYTFPAVTVDHEISAIFAPVPPSPPPPDDPLPEEPEEPETIVESNTSDNPPASFTSGGSGRVFFLPENPANVGPVGEIVVGNSEGQVLGDSTFRFNNNLRRGSRFAPDVTELQKRLTAELYYFGPITGYFGPYTVLILRDYQQAHGLPVTGLLDEATRQELNSDRIVANPKVVQKLLSLTI